MSLLSRFKNLKLKAEELVKGGRSGRRIYGGIYRLEDGRRIYLAYRYHKEIFRSGEKTVSEAVDKNVACWAIDYDTLLKLRRMGIKLVGIYVRDQGDIYLTEYANFFDETKTSVKNYSSKGGALQKYLPIQYFASKKSGAIK